MLRFRIGRVALRRLGRHQRSRADRGDEAHDIDAVRPREAEASDDDPADRGPDDERRLEHRLVQRERGRELRFRYEVRGDRRPHCQREAREARDRRGREVHDHDVGVADHRDREQHPRRHRLAGLGHEQEPAPVDAVDERAAEHGDPDERHQLHQTDRTHRERRVGEPVHLDVQGDETHERAGLGDQLAEPQEPEVTRRTERSDVDGDPPDPGHEAAARWPVAR